MPNNENLWAKELLSWHSHDRGGVHVPFQAVANPYGSVIVTGLVERLRGLARTIAAGTACPRWIFLIGGPGNGKSETVEDFLGLLDDELGMGGALRTRLANGFAPSPLVPRRVEVTTADMAGAPGSFAQRVGRLIIVQDATATDVPDGNAANQLALDVSDLLTTPETPPPVFVACTNRGLLSRALKEAHIEFSATAVPTRLFAELIRASSLGLEALRMDRPSCWPLQDHPDVACWPLDQESLLIRQETAPSPVEQVLTKATELPMWEVPGRCTDCDSAPVCPFRQNAEWLRQDEQRKALSRILRHGELATGQRWNFRDTFSLAAELLVGDWSDFGGADHPCKWVHGHATLGGTHPTPETLAHAFHLLRRLYPHALFPTPWMREAAERLEKEVDNFADQPFSEAFIQELADDPGAHPKPIREKLLKEYARFDPATYTPASADHVLHKVETEYSQSVAVGNDVPRDPGLSAAESRFLECLALAEQEWDLLGRESSAATKFVHLLRRAACILVKRSLGARIGHHAFEVELEEFSATLRNPQKLNLLKDALQQILGRDRFRFNLVESYGQPAAEEDKLVILDGSKPGLRTFPAPLPAPTAPAHDVPCFSIGSGSTYRIPITFDFFLALVLRSTGCANSSLPASVRAAIDRVRHRYAGELCRKRGQFADGTAQIVLGGTHAITLSDEDSEPAITPL
jgi:hypothetical protein